MYTYTCEKIACFRLYLFVRASFAQTLYIRRSTEEGRPDRVVEVWARSVLCAARGVRSNFFCRREWTRRFLGFSFRGVLYQVSSVFEMFFFAHTYRCETARLTTTLGSLCRDRFEVHWSSKFGRAACRVLCVSRVHMPGVMRSFFLQGKKKKNRPPAQTVWLGATLSLRTRVRASASVPFCFFLFVISPLFLKVGAFAQILYAVMYLFGTARLATTLAFPVQGQV